MYCTLFLISLLLFFTLIAKMPSKNKLHFQPRDADILSRHILLQLSLKTPSVIIEEKFTAPGNNPLILRYAFLTLESQPKCTFFLARECKEGATTDQFKFGVKCLLPMEYLIKLPSSILSANINRCFMGCKPPLMMC